MKKVIWEQGQVYSPGDEVECDKSCYVLRERSNGVKIMNLMSFIPPKIDIEHWELKKIDKSAIMAEHGYTTIILPANPTGGMIEYYKSVCSKVKLISIDEKMFRIDGEMVNSISIEKYPSTIRAIFSKEGYWCIGYSIGFMED